MSSDCDVVASPRRKRPRTRAHDLVSSEQRINAMFVRHFRRRWLSDPLRCTNSTERTGRPCQAHQASKDLKTRRFQSTMSTSAMTGNPKHNGHVQPSSSWLGYRGAAGFDLRSTSNVANLSRRAPRADQLTVFAGDTMTTPTPAMLASIESCSLLDDVFVEDPTTMDLEAHVASLAGKEAGLLVLSGTMGNQLALRSLLTQPPHSVLCDHRSHIIKYEAGGYVGSSRVPRRELLNSSPRQCFVLDGCHDRAYRPLQWRIPQARGHCRKGRD